MKILPVPTPVLGIFQIRLALFVCLTTGSAAFGQNSWIRPTSSNWEIASNWSTGTLPGSGQSVIISNAGWKAVQISANTSQNYTQSMTIDSLTVSAPIDTFNTLFMNSAGKLTPLTLKSGSVGSNCAIVMDNSAIFLNGPTGAGLSIGGRLDQINSDINGNQMDVGWVGPGIYNLTNGSKVAVGHLWVGGPNAGVMNQYPGTSNGVGIVHLEGGTYNYYGGDFTATVYFTLQNYTAPGTFIQKSGRLEQALSLHHGMYILENGINAGGLIIPIGDGWSAYSGNSTAVQLGGTNFGTIRVGYVGSGSYTLSNGVVATPQILSGVFGNFIQSGGSVVSTGAVVIAGDYVNRGDRAGGNYTLNTGTLTCPAVSMGIGTYTQNGGTNTIAGDFTVGADFRHYIYLNGGRMTEQNLNIDYAYVGGLFQNGGVHVISNQLSVTGGAFPGLHGIFISGGQLTVSNIVVNQNSTFDHTGGTIIQSGLFTLANNAMLRLGGGPHSFGRLQITSASTNGPGLFLPTNSAAVVQFGNSSALVWSNAPLTIRYWNGSPTGGGNHRIIFGNSSNALTELQLENLVFLNPEGFTPGEYPAKILSTGEIVPSSLSDTSLLAAKLNVKKQPGGVTELTIQGPMGNYTVQVSSNLLTWTPLTSQSNSVGTLIVQDLAATNFPRRFYRTVYNP